MATTRRHNQPLLFFTVMSVVVHTGLLADFLAHRPPLIDAAGKASQITMHLHLRHATAAAQQRTVHDDSRPPNAVPARTKHTENRSAPPTHTIRKAAAEDAPARIQQSKHSAGPQTASAASRDENYRQAASHELHNWLVQAIAAHFTYPAIARRHHWQGKVRIALRIEADGRVSHIDLVNSSGHAVLDQAALNTLAKIARIPNATAWLRGHDFDMVIPIEYRLLDG